MPEINEHLFKNTPIKPDPLATWWFKALFAACIVLAGAAECGDVRADTLTLNTTPAERHRGASWADRFESQALVERNGGVVSGAPTFSPDGVALDGAADYLTYALTGREFSSAGIAIVIEFTSEFETGEDVARYLYDTNVSHRYAVYINDNAGNNTMVIYMGDAVIAAVPEATYSPFWNVGTRNILVISGITGDTSAWLNGSLILDADASAWSAKTPIQLFAGCRNNTTAKFHGTIHRIQVYKTQLEDQECIDISTNAVYHYINEATLHLPFGAAEHDPSNVRTLDVSGNNAHAIFGDGSTPTTYPTKLTDRHGYYYDGGDYLVVPATGLVNSVGVSFAVEFYPDFETDADAYRYWFDSTGGARYLVYKKNNAGANVLGVWLGSTNIAEIAEAAYSPFWRKGRRNLLIITGDSVNDLTNIWLNEGKILDADATAWTPTDPANLWIGSGNTPSLYFAGAITHLAVYPFVLTATQRADLQFRLQTRVSKQ